MREIDLIRNYYALLISICKRKSAKESLIDMRISPETK